MPPQSRNNRNHTSGPAKPPLVIARWVAGVVTVFSAAATICGMFAANKKIAVLAFIGMVFALVLLFLVAKAAKDIAQGNSSFYEFLVKAMVVFILLYFVITTSLLLPSIVCWLKGEDCGGPMTQINPAEKSVVETMNQIFEVVTNADDQIAYRESESLAQKMDRIDDAELNLAYDVLKYEYSAYAYLSAASTSKEAANRQRLASSAIDRATNALSRITNIWNKSQKDVGELNKRFYKTWAEEIRTRKDGEQAQFFLAAATAIKADHTNAGEMAEAKKLFQTLPEGYRRDVYEAATNDPWLGPILAKTGKELE